MVGTRAQINEKQAKLNAKVAAAKSLGHVEKKSNPGKQNKADGLNPIEKSTPPPQDSIVSSPTSSEGPEFAAPINISQDAIAAAKQGNYEAIPRGHVLQTDKCYRNALVVFLLSSGRLMSWIEHRYIPMLKAAGVTIKTKVGEVLEKLDNLDKPGKDSKKSKKTDKTAYTDVWCELKDLHSLNVRPVDEVKPKDINSAMGKFWKWLKKQSDEEEGSLWEDRFQGYQDSHELFMWWLQLNARLLEEHIEDLLSEEVDRKTRNARRRLLDTGGEEITKEIITIFTTVRMVCANCGIARGVETRMEKPDNTAFLKISLAFKAGKKTSEPRDMKELIEDDLRRMTEGYRCPKCYDKLEKQYSGKETRERRRLYTLPEVLIVQLVRFTQDTNKKGEMVGTKNYARVKFEEVLDLDPFMEKRMPKRSSTKYRLMGIINHDGKGIQDDGHFTNYVRAGHYWYGVNNTSVRKTDIEVMVDTSYKQPYLFIYERIQDVDDNSKSYAGVQKDDEASKASEKAAREKAAEKAAAPKRAAQRDAVEKAAAALATKTGATRKGVTGNGVTGKDVVKDVSPKKTTPKKTTQDKTSPKRVSPRSTKAKKTTPEKSPPRRVSPRLATLEKVIDGNDAVETDAVDKEADTEKADIEDENHEEANDDDNASIGDENPEEDNDNDGSIVSDHDEGADAGDATSNASIQSDDQNIMGFLPTVTAHGQTWTQYLQTAKEGTPDPEKWVIDVKATINGYTIKFPRYTLRPWTSTQWMTRYDADIEMEVTDGQRRSAKIAGKAEVKLVQPSTRKSTSSKTRKRKSDDIDAGTSTTKNKKQKRGTSNAAAANNGDDDDFMNATINGGDKDYETTPEGSSDNSLFNSPPSDSLRRSKRKRN
ncbi:hypothetical protein LTR10_018787 [Elasticomyces elasticus]|nr:hypothetical protein LTR10_018787 [Elasticomyces elasticus]KAK5029913.1 hypothetical protein LTS07_005637 [Exophiala sideris]